MSVIEKNKLKKAFEAGSIPSQADFENLIDSMVHKFDDGFVSEDKGLRLSPRGEKSKLMSFFETISDFDEKWSIERSYNTNDDFSLNIKNRNNESVMTLLSNGNIGINNTSPASTLDVNGTITSSSRRGSFAAGQIPADGNWYVIVPKLSDCHAFEVVAKASAKGRGMHSMIHAIAISTFGNSNSKVQTVNAYFGSMLNKIDLRWRGDTFNYNLQMRTRRNFGEGCMANYHVTNLF